MKDTPILAIKGCVDWYEHGRCKYGTYHRGPLSKGEVKAPICVDEKEILEKADNPVALLRERPNLDLSLPDWNVRNLFEGCIGFKGSTKGHKWDGKLGALKSSDAVGLRVYLAILRSQGAKITDLSDEALEGMANAYPPRYQE